MRIFETQELEEIIEALQPNNQSYRFWNFHSIPEWVKEFGLGPHGIRLLMWISEAAAWCEASANKAMPETSLRSLSIQKVAFRESRYDYIYDIQKLRSSSLYYQGRLLKACPKSLIQTGRLLVFFPDMNLEDGAAAARTNGYFAPNNLPPWDTWIDYFEEPYVKEESNVGIRKYLIAWVPNIFVDVVQGGIEVNPEMCIQWLENANNVFTSVWEDLSSAINEHQG